MEVKIVLGHAFGDEGKGVTVQWLCKEAIAEGKKPIVVRFSGGAQAGHTIVNNGVEHICSSFGSGVLLGVPTAYTEGFYFDPICFMNEYKVLKEKGITPNYYLSNYGRVVTPVDTIVGLDDQKVRRDGTCGKGIYKAFKRQGCYVPILNQSNAARTHYDNAAEYYNYEAGDEYREAFIESFMAADQNSCRGLNFSDYDVIIFEGSQGLLLDMEHGFYPHVTPSRVGLNGVPCCYFNNAEIYLVTRTYLTRHGNGYIPIAPCAFDLSYKHETNVMNEFQGEFKIGALEVDMLNIAYQRHCLDNTITKYNMKLNLVFTHTDVIGDVFTFFACGEMHYMGRRGSHLVRSRDTARQKFVYVDFADIWSELKKYLCYHPDHVYFNGCAEPHFVQRY
jgi:adenylosuccinate synthase